MMQQGKLIIYSNELVKIIQLIIRFILPGDENATQASQMLIHYSKYSIFYQTECKSFTKFTE